MSIYALGVLASLVLYFVIGNVVGSRVKDTNDYYVSGRNANVALITGSLVASFLGTGVFLGDCGESYMGFMIPIMVVSVMACAGYPLGSALFGRYVRRSEARTIPEYFSIRFADKKIQRLAGVIVVFICFVYLLSVMDGLSTLMAQIIPFSREACLVIAWVTFTFFTVFAGSKGVLITDTIMFGIFSASILVAVPAIASAAGGWFNGIATLAVEDVGVTNMLAFGGNLEWMYDTAWANFGWAVSYGVVWMLVVSVSPWQSSRYLMAKDEHTVIRSGAWACIGVLFLNTVVLFAPVLVRVVNQDVDPYSTVMIWAAMNLMPVAAGILLITGIVAAGISSASTFLSLIGFAVVNDITEIEDDGKALKYSRIAMLVISVLVLCVSLVKPAMIWWMTQFSSSVVAASWGVVAFASVWWKRITRRGAFLSMLFGFVASFTIRLYALGTGTTFPLAFDPFWVGIYGSLIGLFIGTYTTQVSAEEQAQLEKLHIVPEIEKDADKIRKTKRMGYILVLAGVAELAFLVIFWAMPFSQAIAG